ncbi:MAG TPA: C-terminal helicase domain-containing protein, partial [Candidatus Saccharibacteria bacterium]|nr:C-terminal helicase domain-containing protein [Candidatus Saccharibacteria bacterium]
FDKSLQDYLKKGYAASTELGVKGIPIGFVMTIYRKLAASSIAAIYNALLNRRVRLNGKGDTGNINGISEQDQRFFGEWEEQLQTETNEFFEGELRQLDMLISTLVKLRKNDRKIEFFIEKLVDTLLLNNNNEKVLIFTEYRATQNYLKEALQSRFGQNSVELINGSMSHQRRLEAIIKFEESAQFLISTEAGGEGINLQHKCHIMVNYDLPWNPMRLVQRIGRIYRYGQKQHVVVFNIHSPNTADEQIMELMYSRINQIVSDMAIVSNDFNEQMQDDILGEIADLLDVNQILVDALISDIDRTQERINEALAKAKAAIVKQRELFEYAASTQHPKYIR